MKLLLPALVLLAACTGCTHTPPPTGPDHPAYIGALDDAQLAQGMSAAFRHDALLEAGDFIDMLGERLSEGVITGYDLRLKGVYDNLPAGRTFIYSQSSQQHMVELARLLDEHGLQGSLYITPKISAFLFRDGWGEPSDRVVTLPGGVQVVNGREIAAMFEFSDRRDRLRFHDLITRFAKKDYEDEPGLIANSWWQPFYYTDEPLEGFEPISLVVVTGEKYEATLTVLEERTSLVTDAFEDSGYPMRVDRVWVNPPFFRFLNGDYK